MRETFSLGDTSFADVRIMNVDGRKGVGFYQLAIQVGVNMHARAEDQAVLVTDLSADLYLQEGAGHGPLVGHMVTREQDIPFHSLNYNQEHWITFDLELDAARVEAVEAVRSGRVLSLRFHVEGTAIKPRESRPQRIRAQILHVATQSDWVRVLDGMGYRKTLLLEIPMPDSDAPEELRKAVEHLRQAQDLMIHGRYREAVGACRDVLDSLGAGLADEQDQPPEAVRGWFEGTRGLDKAGRVRLARRALKVLTHPARHADEVSARHEWGPVDAMSIVTATAALMRLATQD